MNPSPVWIVVTLFVATMTAIVAIFREEFKAHLLEDATWKIYVGVTALLLLFGLNIYLLVFLLQVTDPITRLSVFIIASQTINIYLGFLGLIHVFRLIRRGKRK